MLANATYRTGCLDSSTDNIGLHLKNIFKESDLEENSVTEEFSVTASDGKTGFVLIRNLLKYYSYLCYRNIKIYNLEREGF